MDALSGEHVLEIPPVAFSGLSSEQVSTFGATLGLRTCGQNRKMSKGISGEQIAHVPAKHFSAWRRNCFSVAEESSTSTLSLEQVKNLSPQVFRVLSGPQLVDLANRLGTAFFRLPFFQANAIATSQFKRAVRKNSVQCPDLIMESFPLSELKWTHIACITTGSKLDEWMNREKLTAEAFWCQIPASAFKGLQPALIPSLKIASLCDEQLNSLAVDSVRSLTGPQWAALGPDRVMEVGLTGVREWPLSFINPQAVGDLTDDQLMVIAQRGSETCFLLGNTLNHKLGCLLGAGKLVYGILSESGVPGINSGDFFNYSIGCPVLRRLDDAAFGILLSQFPNAIARCAEAGYTTDGVIAIYNRSVRSLKRNRECCMYTGTDSSGNSPCTNNEVRSGESIFKLSYGRDQKSCWPLPYTQFDGSWTYDVDSGIRAAIKYPSQPVKCKLANPCGGHNGPQTKTSGYLTPLIAALVGVLGAALAAMVYIIVRKRQGRSLLPSCLRGETREVDSTGFRELVAQ
jgi:hypothetical protein